MLTTGRLRAVPKGKALRWRDLRGEGHERYARMAGSPPKHRTPTSPLTGEVEQLGRGLAKLGGGAGRHQR